MRTVPAELARPLALALGLALGLGCALHKAQSAMDQGRYEEALAQYRRILDKDPRNLQARLGCRRAAPLAAEEHLKKAREARKAGREPMVRQEVAAAVVLDSSNAVAMDWMARIEEAAARQRQAEETEDSIDQARAEAGAKPVLPINPRSLEGMDLNFSRKTSLKEILQQLSRNSGVNIILHASASATDISVSVDLRGLTFQRILDTLMLQSDLFYKVLDANTLMVFKKTPQNLNDFENKLIQTFYLSNAEVDSIRQIFSAIMPQMRVFIDKRLNAITVQAKANDLAVASRIVNQLDKAKAEVVVYLELIEVNEDSRQAVGLIPTANPLDPTAPGLYRIGAALKNDQNQSTLLNQDQGGIRISKSQLIFQFAPLALDALKASGEGKLLASPNVRVVSGETGEVNIGEKISTTQSQLGGLPNAGSSVAAAAAGALSSLGGALTTQTQYSYEDTGVNIKVKPRVHFNGDITIDLESTVRSELTSTSTPGRPNLGQRIIKTSARLRDGETAVFGGLLKEEESKELEGIWGISDIPVLGKLLGHNRGKKKRTDVLLTLRAVIVRKAELAEPDFEPFDPDLAGAVTRPFAPRPPRKALPAGLAGPEAPAPAPAAPPAPAEAAAPDPVEQSPLVFFMSPLTAEAPKGEPVVVTLFASGAQGLTEGTMTLRVDPRLKVAAITPGAFLTGAKGALEQAPGMDGRVTLTFRRAAGGADSGVLATLRLEPVEAGKATVLIQDGQYRIGANPVPARYVNSLITVL